MKGKSSEIGVSLNSVAQCPFITPRSQSRFRGRQRHPCRACLFSTLCSAGSLLKSCQFAHACEAIRARSTASASFSRCFATARSGSAPCAPCPALSAFSTPLARRCLSRHSAHVPGFGVRAGSPTGPSWRSGSCHFCACQRLQRDRQRHLSPLVASIAASRAARACPSSGSC